MLRSKFVAAQSSRHRTAALALYRALVRTASRVPLPQEVQKPAPVGGPLVQIVRKRFAKNTPYTSYRLIYAAMTAGYKFLSLLTKAQTPDSPEYHQVVNHLQGLHRTSEASRSAAPQRTRKPPTLPSEPLLINTAQPWETPKYTSNILPRPKSSLPKYRKVPSLCTTADSQPFVRILKPQPRALSRMVGRKGRIFTNRIMSIMETDEDLVPEAALEDEWDNLMVDLMEKEKREHQHEHEGRALELDDPKETFSWSVQLTRLWWEWKIETTWEDWIARGDALQELVEKEEILLAQEKGINTTKRNRQPVQYDKTNDPDDKRPNVGQSPFPVLPVVAAVKAIWAAQPSSNNPEDKMVDPFISETWAALVQSETSRMLRWMKRGAYGQNVDSLPFEYSWKRPEKETKSQPSPE
ncbi:hypothetical protein PT974_01926 [Cladobotryum mycophilum]|uniref:Ubiquitin-conjugating enzyme n=1 Tax=Cladobotryum mycophilum TaxID=491253 RepID=A0ABR0SX44_9HYPO